MAQVADRNRVGFIDKSKDFILVDCAFMDLVFLFYSFLGRRRITDVFNVKCELYSIAAAVAGHKGIPFCQNRRLG